MTSPSWSLVRGLNPTPTEARNWLQQELHGSDYQSPWLDSLSRWITDQLGKLLDGANHLAGLSPAITALIALVVIALLAWILPKVRRERVVAGSDGVVLEDVPITARLYRSMAAPPSRDVRY